MPVWKYQVVNGGSPGTEEIFTVIAGSPELNVTSMRMRYSGPDPVIAVFKGSGIATDIAGNVTGGTITSLTVKALGNVALIATGLNVAAKAVFDRIAAEDSFDLAQTMFKGADSIFGTRFGEDLFGFNGRDRINAGGGADFVSGGNGNDRLYGGAGRDSLNGDGGDNLLSGGAGKDQLIGNDGGEDRFVFNTGLRAGTADVIVDFNALNDDRILLDNDIFTALGAAGALAPGRLRMGTEAGDASDRIIYDSTTGKLFYDKDGTGNAGQRLIAVLGGDSAGPGSLAAADFLIIN